jgi:DNA-3-methyladenine glycosylase
MGRADALKRDHPKDGYCLITRATLPVDTMSLARYLIGKMLVRELPEGSVGGRIVETEAYIVGDAAGHAYRGMTERNRSLFLEPGHAYVYLAYGRSYMLNVSSEKPGIGAGVLIRAIEPLEGIPIMQINRGIDHGDFELHQFEITKRDRFNKLERDAGGKPLHSFPHPALKRLHDLARGPGRLAAALRINRSLDALDLCREGPLWLGHGGAESGEIGQSVRIGISRDADRLLRFYLRNSRFVSGPKSLNP